MLEAVPSPWLVPFDGSFDPGRLATLARREDESKKELKRRLKGYVRELAELQRKLYADDRFSLLLIFQAMDAAGKDGTIRAVLSGVNPAGCEVYSFKQPSAEELDHDFLWRSAKRLPQRGRIGVFNRSYYEEVLVVRVHPEYLEGQRLPWVARSGGEIWQQRFDSIRDHELHLARNGTIILKFWLNVSREEQRRRFLARIEDPEKNWKFSTADVRERGHWDKYMAAYREALAETSRPWAPWYAIPADDKPWMRVAVAEIVVATLRSLPLSYPAVGEQTRAEFARMRSMLEGEGG
ncbi:MAG TPA: polyphosphate kinase 2 family protein [Gammaproteobacteria bacterium]|nr:polyphosphate kinase 2 family protein [Gammaproteobacteria bacterium]